MPRTPFSRPVPFIRAAVPKPAPPSGPPPVPHWQKPAAPTRPAFVEPAAALPVPRWQKGQPPPPAHVPKPTWAPTKEHTEKNLLFVCVGPGKGVVPVRKEPGATYKLVEVLWHPEMIRDYERGTYTSDADLVVLNPDRTKRKFACLADAWEEIKEDFGDFDAVAIADDDLEPRGTTWGDIFALFHESPFVCAQPALSHDSVRPMWHHLLRDEECLYRKTNFVEVMIPMFKERVLADLIPYFAEEKNGWGLEALWTKICAPLGVLDGTPIRHARPAGSAHSLSGHKEDPKRQADAFRARHGLVPITPAQAVTFVRYLRSGQAERVILPHWQNPEKRTTKKNAGR